MQTTWNIIFFGINLSTNTALEDNETKTIVEGIESFKADVKKTNYSEFLKITLLEFLSPADIGTATIYKNEMRAGKNLMEPNRLYHNFNCYVSENGKKNDYADFIKSCIGEEQKNSSNKYIIIFLAHSFGAGFFYNKSSGGYLSVKQLSKAIEGNFAIEKKANCFIALNCSLQSVQSNCIFSPAVDYFIGSQQPLHIKAVRFQHLFDDLVYSIQMHNGNITGYPDEIIYTKFIYDCYANFKTAIKNNADNGIEIFDNFCLSLTKPFIANAVDVKINKLAKLIKEDPEKGNNTDLDYFNFSARFCEDPSYLDRVNIVDATQFFLKLQTFYQQDNKKWGTIEEILELMRKIVLVNLSSTDILYAETDEEGSARMYVPMGIGIIIPKVLSKHLETIINEMPIYEKAFGELIKNLIDILDKQPTLPSK